MYQVVTHWVSRFHSWRQGGRRVYPHVVLGIVLLCIMLPHSLGLVQYGVVDLVESRLYDQRMKWLPPVPAHDDRIVIIDVDEASLQQVGRWPWHRATVSKLVDELLQRQKVAVLGFDVLFAEPETDDQITQLQDWWRNHAQRYGVPDTELRALQQQLNGDRQLAQSIHNQPVVLGYYVSSSKSPVQTGQLPPPLQQTGASEVVYPHLYAIEGYTSSLPGLATSSRSAGFINALTEKDGILRSIPLVMQRSTGTGQKPEYYGSLSLLMFMQLLQVDAVRLLSLEAQAGGNPPMTGVQLQQGNYNLTLPTDPFGAMLVPYRGTGGPVNGQYRYVSAKDVLAHALAPGQLAGKVVLVGTSAPGLRDMRSTPFNETFPGVEVHASVLSAMLDGKLLYKPDYARGYAALSVLLATVVLLMALPRLGMLGALLICAAMIAVLVAVNVWFYVQGGIALPLATSLITVVSIYILHTSLGFLIESRTKSQLVELFGHYVPAELVKRMARSPGNYTTRAQSMELSIMFCDVQQFTRLSEIMAPKDLQDLLNRLFNRTADVIAATSGTIDKYIGDCVMAFWGAPLPDAEHASHAVAAAIAMQGMMVQFNAEQRAAGQPELSLGIGINTGVVSVGDMGSNIRRSYTVIGDAVNLASRLEALAKHYALDIVVGERTTELAQGYVWQWVDRVRVTGKMQVVRVYTPLGQIPLSPRLEQEDALWRQFHEAYLSRQWDQCHRLLASLRLLQPYKYLYVLYQQRLEHFLAEPPPDNWDGVHETPHKLV